MRRRRFFQVSALSALVLTSALFFGERVGGRRARTLPRLRGPQLRGQKAGTIPDTTLPAAPSRREAAEVWSPRCLTPKQLLVLHCAALRLLDGADAAPEASAAAGSVSLEGAAAEGAAADALADLAGSRLVFIDRYLSRLDVGLRADVRALLELLEHYPLVTGRFARFSRLAADEQDAVLRAWQESRITLLRQGLAALKSMVFLAHYGDERSFGALGYTGPLVAAPRL